MGCDLSPGRVAIIVSVLVVVVAAIALLASSLKKLEAFEVGVGYDTIGRQLGSDVKSEGLYAYVPGTEILLFPNVFKVINFEDRTCLNYDGANIRLSVTYQFRPRRDSIVAIIRRYRTYDNYEKLLKIAGEAEIQKACSMFNTYDIIAKRADFAQKAKELISQRYDGLSSDISGLQVDNIARPEQYNDALRQKEAVRENIVVKLNERQKKIIEGEIKREEAVADATIAMETAEVDARIALLEAGAEAAAITKQFEVEAEIYKKLGTAGFTGKSLVSYMQIDALSSAKHPVFVGLEAPANFSQP